MDVFTAARTPSYQHVLEVIVTRGDGATAVRPGTEMPCARLKAAMFESDDDLKHIAAGAAIIFSRKGFKWEWTFTCTSEVFIVDDRGVVVEALKPNTRLIPVRHGMRFKLLDPEEFPVCSEYQVALSSEVVRDRPPLLTAPTLVSRSGRLPPQSVRDQCYDQIFREINEMNQHRKDMSLAPDSKVPTWAISQKRKFDDARL